MITGGGWSGWFLGEGMQFDLIKPQWGGGGKKIFGGGTKIC